MAALNNIRGWNVGRRKLTYIYNTISSSHTPTDIQTGTHNTRYKSFSTGYDFSGSTWCRLPSSIIMWENKWKAGFRTRNRKFSFHQFYNCANDVLSRGSLALASFDSSKRWKLIFNNLSLANDSCKFLRILFMRFEMWEGGWGRRAAVRKIFDHELTGWWTC